MRQEEEFVLKSLARLYSGQWRLGEDPPDGYLTLAGYTVAIEVSKLGQHVTDDKGTRPRLSDDIAAIRLANQLDAEFKSAIPINKRVMLILRPPIEEYRKTKAGLATEILSLVRGNPGPDRAERKTSIRGNNIEIYLDESDGNESKRIFAAVAHRTSSPNIVKNVLYILEDRIRVKGQKCAKLTFDGPIWLALLNEYFPSDVGTYRFAMKSVLVEHPFEKILLVSDDGSVIVLQDSHAT
jgi:hypothetical protein